MKFTDDPKQVTCQNCKKYAANYVRNVKRAEQLAHQTSAYHE